MSLPAAPSKAYLLADSARKPLAASLEGGLVKISVPAAAPDPVASVVVVEMDGR